MINPLFGKKYRNINLIIKINKIAHNLLNIINFIFSISFYFFYNFYDIQIHSNPHIYIYRWIYLYYIQIPTYFPYHHIHQHDIYLYSFHLFPSILHCIQYQIIHQQFS